MSEPVIYSSRRKIEPSDELRAAVKTVLEAFAAQAPDDGGFTLTAETETPAGKAAVLLTYLPKAPD